jgi:glucose-6-phosphate isomerase
MIRYDYQDMMRSRVGSEGVDAADLAALAGRLAQARLALDAQRQEGKLGFFDVPKSRPSLHPMLETLTALPPDVETLVVVGIGGSLLGAQAIHRALVGLAKPRYRHLKVVFAGDAVDPQAWLDFDASIDWQHAAVNVISKSGDTIEPMAIFMLCRERLVKARGAAGAAKRIVATTDAERGTLHDLARREGYATLPVPGNVGGRFSVLTPVAAFPLLAAGIDIEALWAGAAEEAERFWMAPPSENLPMTFASLQYLLYRQGKTVSVLMPYVQRLQLLGAWYRQLWAESLGKKIDRSRKVVNVGPTPIAAQGPADQHSQVQLYNEGPHDKSVTFVEVDREVVDVKLPTPFPDIEGLAYFGGHALGEIVRAERAATSEALTLNRRPNGTWHLPDLSARSVGALLQGLMIATAVAGELFDVNAYDQPGVEAGKRAMYRLLGREGFKQ